MWHAFLLWYWFVKKSILINIIVSCCLIWPNSYTPQKTKMTMEKQPFEDVSPVRIWKFSHCHVRFSVGSSQNLNIMAFRSGGFPYYSPPFGGHSQPAEFMVLMKFVGRGAGVTWNLGETGNTTCCQKLGFAVEDAWKKKKHILPNDGLMVVYHGTK